MIPKKKHIYLALGGLLTLAAITPRVAHAGLLNIGADVLMFVVFFSFYVMQYLAGFAFSFAGYATGKALEFNYGILNSSNALVNIGWTLARDLANLGFVLVIIIIAISTIVRYNEYGSQKLLFKLIAAAIVVNFSLTIAGVFIDFSHVLSRFFFKPLLSETEINGNSLGVLPTTKLVKTLSGAFDPQKLFAEPEEPEPFDTESGSGFWTGYLLKLGGLFFTIIFTVIATIVMFAIGTMLFLRYLHLTFLLITSPIIWLFWVVPGQGSHFSKWWQEFTKWVAFLPSMSFFLYLALVSVQKMNEGFGAVAPGSFFTNGAIAALSLQGINMAVLCAFLVYGLQTAQAAGVTGASYFMGVLKKQGNNLKDRIQQRAERVATAPLRTQTGRKVVDWMQTTGQNTWWARGITAPIRQAGAGLAKATRKVDKQVGEAGKDLDGLSYDEMARQYGLASNPKKVAILKKIADDGKKLGRDEKDTAVRLERAERNQKSAEARFKEVERQLKNKGMSEEDMIKDKDYSEANDKYISAENQLTDARNNYNKASGDRQKLETALSQLPNKVRHELEEAQFDLMNTRSPRTKFFGKEVPILSVAAAAAMGQGIPTGGFMKKVPDVASNKNVSEARKADGAKSFAQRTAEFFTAPREKQIATLLDLVQGRARKETDLNKAKEELEKKTVEKNKADENLKAMPNFQEVVDAEEAVAKASSAVKEVSKNFTEKFTEAEEKQRKAGEKWIEATKALTKATNDRARAEAAGASADMLTGMDNEIANLQTSVDDFRKEQDKATGEKTKLEKDKTTAEAGLKTAETNRTDLKTRRTDYDSVAAASEAVKGLERERKRAEERVVGDKSKNKGLQAEFDEIEANINKLPQDVLQQLKDADYKVNKMDDFIKGFEGYTGEARP